MPTTSRSERQTITVDGVWDMECANWTHPVLIVTLHRVHGVELHTTVGEAVERMARLGGTWWSHNGGHYDTLAALEYMRASGKSRLINVSQGRVTRTSGDGLTLADSYALVPLGLEAAAELGGLAAPALDWPCRCGGHCGGYCSITKRLSLARRAELTAYCVADCEALWKMLTAVMEWAAELDLDLRGTIGGSAWATVRRQLLLPDADNSPALERRLREAYYGGRCGVYRHRADAGRQWDMTMAYPSALAMPVPVGHPSELGPRDAVDALNARRPGIYAATVLVPESKLPPLPWRHAGRIYYPHGVVSGAWTLPELEAALADGVKVVRVMWAIVWPREEAVFEGTVERWAGWRAGYGKESAKGRMLRSWPNSLIGKLAERGDRNSVRLHPPVDEVLRNRCRGKAPCTLAKCTGRCGMWRQLDRWGELWAAPYYRQAPSAHVQWAAYATARTRVAWRAEALRHGDDLVYGDTDSIWTTRSTSPRNIGAGLHQWELKDTWSDFEAVGHKQYRHRSIREDRDVFRTAGARVTSSDWQEGEASQDRGAASLLTAARGGRGYFVRRAERWTLPELGEWCGDRLVDGDGLTRAPTVAQVRARKAQR